MQTLKLINNFILKCFVHEFESRGMKIPMWIQCFEHMFVCVCASFVVIYKYNIVTLCICVPVSWRNHQKVGWRTCSVHSLPAASVTSRRKTFRQLSRMHCYSSNFAACRICNSGCILYTWVNTQCYEIQSQTISKKIITKPELHVCHM